MHRNLETLTTFFVQVRNVYGLLEFSLSTRGERETQFLLCWPFHLTQQTLGASCRPQSGHASSSFKSQLASPRFKFQLASPRFKSQLASSSVTFQQTAFFKNHQNSQPIVSRHDVIHTPSPIHYLGFLLWHLWLSYPLHAGVNTCTQSVH